METAKLFHTGRNQAVRLPKAFRFSGDKVYIKKVGSAVVLLPDQHTWDLLFEACDEFSDGFMADRKQPLAQDRPAFD